MSKTVGSSGPQPTADITEGMAYFKGAIRPLSEATVSIATHGLNYGTGCFEGIRAYWNEEEEELYLLKPLEHFERLERSASMLRMKLSDPPEKLVDITKELLRQNRFRSDVYIRPLVFKAGAQIAVRLSGIPDETAIFCTPMGDYLDTHRGLRCMVSAWRRLPDNSIPSRAKPTGGYLNAALAVDDAKLNGYDECLMLTQDGHVAEASSCNLFIVRQGKLITPSVTEDILEGITRSCVLQLAREVLQVEVEERPIDRTELYVADEVFLCGTGVQVSWVGEIDRHVVGDGRLGPITSALQQAYFRAVRGLDPTYRHWLVPALKG